MAPSFDLAVLSSFEKDTLISTLAAQVDALVARVAALETENAALREKLKAPPKTPDNSARRPRKGARRTAMASPARRSGCTPERTAAASQPDPLPGGPRGAMPPLPRRPGRRGPGGGADLRPHRDPRDRSGRDAGGLHGGVCPCCARGFKAAAPAGLEPGSPFGPNLRAFVLYLRFGQAIPFERLARLMRDLFGLEISEGALANLLQHSAQAFAAQASLIKQRLLSSTVLASDETSVRVGKKTFWTWVFHDADSACFVIRPSRGKAAVGEFLGDVRPAVWISDRLGAQMGWATRDHQVCLAHLLRDIQYAIDAGDAAFAPGMKHLLQRAVRIGHRRPALADATLAAYHARLQRALDDLLKIVPDNKPGLKLQRIIKRFRQSLFVFLTDREASPTNNGSEQALRPCVIFRKITNGFRSAWGADLYADVRSVLESARRRGVGILHALRLTLDGRPLPTAA